MRLVLDGAWRFFWWTVRVVAVDGGTMGLPRVRYVGVGGALGALALLLAGCGQPAAQTPSPGFTVALSPAALSDGLADSATTDLSLTSQHGFSGTVSLSLLDAGGQAVADVSVSPGSVTLPAGQSVAVPMKVTPDASVPAGTYSFTLSATGSGVTHATSLVLALSSTATGSFAAATNSPFTVGSVPRSVAVGDVNGDGKPDLAVANDGSGSVSVLLGDGSGGFAAASKSPFTVGSSPVSVAVGDFNGDGKLDLATANYSSNGVSVLLGDGSGGFAAASTSPFTVGTNPYSVAVGDFNGDGTPDLAVSNYGSPPAAANVEVLLGNGDGTFPTTTAPAYPAGVGLWSVAVGEFNGDGKLDLATANSGGNSASVLLGQ